MAETDLLEKVSKSRQSSLYSSLSLRGKNFYMPRNHLHFEISERKFFLRLFDVVWVLFALYVVGILFRIDYFQFESGNWSWSIVLAGYLAIFAGVFELYDLQKASNFTKVLQNTVLATSVTVLFFLLTPVLTPVLPENRFKILYLFLTILLTLLLWRYAYIALISTPRFYRRVLIVGEPLEVELVASHLQQSDPNYNIIGYVNPEKGDDHNFGKASLEEFPSRDLWETVREYSVDEILISHFGAENSGELYDEILSLLKKGFPVKDFNEVYEDKTNKIPVQHIEKNFYQFFPLSRSNDNKFYLFFHRMADIVISIIGIIIGLLLLPFVFFGNLIANQGRLFYRQERVGKNGRIF